MSLRTKCLIATLLTATAAWAVLGQHGVLYVVIGLTVIALLVSVDRDERRDPDALVSYRYPGGDQ